MKQKGTKHDWIWQVLVSVGCFAAAVLLARLRKEKVALWGLGCGMFCFVLVLLLAVCTGNSEFSALFAFKFISAAVAGALGGICGGMLAEKQRKRRK